VYIKNPFLGTSHQYEYLSDFVMSYAFIFQSHVLYKKLHPINTKLTLILKKIFESSHLKDSGEVPVVTIQSVIVNPKLGE